MTPLQKERRALRRLVQWAGPTRSTVVRQYGTLIHPDGKEERTLLETTFDSATQRVKHQLVKPDPLAGFRYPADAIVPCKMCGVAEGEPCRSLGLGFVHVARRIARLLLTAKARSSEERERFEVEAVKMLRKHLMEKM